MRASHRQLSLGLCDRPSWGGRRRGSGRKRRPDARPCVPHRRRLSPSAHEPALVTLRASRDVGSLRTPSISSAIRAALASCSRTRLQVVHYSIQSDHVHLIVEAAGRQSFTSGMRSLTTRLALAVNRATSRRGHLWSDRFHARALTTPKAVRAALVYVLANARKHLRIRSGLDPYSSAPTFDGYADHRPEPAGGEVVRAPRTWLLRHGWRRHGLLSTSEHPRTPPALTRRRPTPIHCDRMPRFLEPAHNVAPKGTMPLAFLRAETVSAQHMQRHSQGMRTGSILVRPLAHQTAKGGGTQ